MKIKLLEGLGLIVALISTIFGWIYRNEILLFGVTILMLVMIYTKLQFIEKPNH